MELTFRQIGLKKGTKRHILALVLIFIAALVFSFIWVNREVEEDGVAISEPTLPIITMEAMGTTLNHLHGYVKEMDTLYMRDAVVPLGTAGSRRILPITIHTYGRKISEISYEIRSLNTERKISEEKVSDYETSGDTITANLEIANLIEEEEEVLLILKLSSDGDTIRYYTRIVLTDEDYPQQCFTFAKEFHQKALEKDVEFITDYMETEPSDDTTQLYNVTIHSTANQVAWGNFDGEISGEVVQELTDIADDYAAIVFTYEMTRKNNLGSTETYWVEEYFKVRYTTDKMYLLDYERDMHQMIDPDKISVTDGVFPLGVMDKNVNYLSNETGNVVAFEADGRLFEYNQNTGELVTVFSFGDAEDARLKNYEHSILILNIDENGGMDFVVYGYMNAGPHEGTSGIDLFHYDSATMRSTEQTYIESTKSYQILHAGFSDLIYEAGDSNFYIIVDGTLLSVNLNTLATTEIQVQMSKEQYAVSGSGRYFAWIEEKNPAEYIRVLDLETKTEFRIEAGQGELLRPLAFMDDDLVYGVLRKSDIGVDLVGSTVYPMYQVVIANVTSGSPVTLKEYEKDGFYVVDVSKEGYTLYLSRMMKNEEDVYVAAVDDTIKDSSGEQNKAVDVATSTDSVLGTVVEFHMTDEKDKSLDHLVADYVDASASRIITVRAMETETEYFVYVGAKVVYAGSDLTKAITTADDEMGIVLDNSQTYIWKRSKRAYVNAFNYLSVGQLDQNADARSQAISALLNYAGESVDVHTSLNNGETPRSVIESTLKDKMVLDLTGLKLSQVLYYISAGSPVYTELENQEAILLVGYDAANVYVFHPVTGTITFESRSDMENRLTEAGNVFISYVE